MRPLPPWILMLALGTGVAQAGTLPTPSPKPQMPQRLTLTAAQRTQLAQASRHDVARWLNREVDRQA